MGNLTSLVKFYQMNKLSFTEYFGKMGSFWGLIIAFLGTLVDCFQKKFLGSSRIIIGSREIFL